VTLGEGADPDRNPGVELRAGNVVVGGGERAGEGKVERWGGGGVDLASVAIDALFEVDSPLLVLHRKPVDHPQPPGEHSVEDRMHKLLYAGRENRGWGSKVRNTRL
jgi:hypothetical protein